MKWILLIMIVGNVTYEPNKYDFGSQEECLIEAKKIVESVSPKWDEKTIGWNKPKGYAVCVYGYVVKEGI